MVTERDRHGHLVEEVLLPGSRSYPVIVGDGGIERLSELIPAGTKKAAILTQTGIGVEVDPGCESRVFVVPDGEAAKRLRVVEEICGSLARWGLTRADVVVGIGGGVVTDLAGFVAATYHRGTPVVHVSTTLLGQIDASIGGKCGVNLVEGKNLVGAFWQPSGVICDTATLATLPEIEFLAGLGELAKYHFLGGGNLDTLDLDERVAACIRIKADVVAADEREAGVRATLNYGHTLAHSIETASNYGIRHGAAVAVGLLYAAEVSRLLGRISSERVDEHRRVLAAYGLTSTIPPDLRPSELVGLFSRDKKAIDGITLVLDGPAGVETVGVDDRDLLLAAFDAVT